MTTTIPARGFDWGPLSLRLDRRWHLRVGPLVIARCHAPSVAPLIEQATMTVRTDRPGHHPVTRSGSGYAIRPLQTSVAWLRRERPQSLDDVWQEQRPWG